MIVIVIMRLIVILIIKIGYLVMTVMLQVI